MIRREGVLYAFAIVEGCLLGSMATMVVLGTRVAWDLKHDFDYWSRDLLFVFLATTATEFAVRKAWRP